MADVVVAGAGMAGLVAAAEIRRRGGVPKVVEKLDHPGGSMLLSSGVIWRHRSFDSYRAECPHGDEALQRLLFDRLDADLEWLASIGAPAIRTETGNPGTVGVRFDPAGLTATLAEAAGPIEFGAPLRDLPRGPTILATGGFAASREMLREHVTDQADHLFLRTAPGAEGDGFRLAISAGARPSAGLDEVYGRNMPAPPARIPPTEFVAAAQLFGSRAEITNERGEAYRAQSWSEIDVLQWTARQPRARAWFRVDRALLGERVGERTVGEMVETARRAGAPVDEDQNAVTVETIAGATTTLGGVAIDARAEAAPNLFVAGGDAGGLATGGYASGLAQALVLGRIAAASALEAL
jgi:succinate dehydrogenase/fumarate reductase flavoprotein subunit